MERRDKINYYLDIAEAVTGRGTCLRRNFGAVIVKNDTIISTGYVGAPRGRANCNELQYCTREKLQVLRDHGISRISINPQTMNQKTLDLIGRRHTVEETVQAFYLARELGFDNINMYLIVGLPGEEKAEVEYTLKEITKLDPDSVTVHSLAVKRAARLKLFKEEHKEMTMTNNR